MANRSSTKVTINGVEYTIRFTHMRKDHGSCDNPYQELNPEILIHNKLSEIEELETTIHEILHALNFKMFSEEWVYESASDITQALYRLGWRKKSDDKSQENK